MKAIHLTTYGNPAQSLKMAEVSEPGAPSEGEALVSDGVCADRLQRPPISEWGLPPKT